MKVKDAAARSVSGFEAMAFSFQKETRQTCNQFLSGSLGVIAGSGEREVCELQAESAGAPIKRAIREHGIDDSERQKRLAAYRVRSPTKAPRRAGGG